MTRAIKEKLPIYNLRNIRIHYTHLPPHLEGSLDIEIFKEGCLEYLYERGIELLVYKKAQEMKDLNSISSIGLLNLITWARKNKIDVIHFDGDYLISDVPLFDWEE